MSKDQAIGLAILVLCLLIGIFFVATLFYPQWLNLFGTQMAQSSVQFWVIAIPVLIAFVAILGIGVWIGWTMTTTPPPKPIEELQTELHRKEPDKEEVAS